MDPETTLRRIRQHVVNIIDSPEDNTDDAVELADLFEAMDIWLTRGGYKPEDWNWDNQV